MNCPHHITIYKQDQRSYRDLPVRIAELGRMYRYEKSGTLSGLHRVRSMTLNDAHIFCRPDQVKQEFGAVVRLIQQVYQDFRITDYRLDLSLHDPKDRQYYHQDEELWMTAEGLLHEVLRELGLPYNSVVGGANAWRQEGYGLNSMRATSGSAIRSAAGRWTTSPTCWSWATRRPVAARSPFAAAPPATWARHPWTNLPRAL